MTTQTELSQMSEKDLREALNLYLLNLNAPTEAGRNMVANKAAEVMAEMTRRSK